MNVQSPIFQSQFIEKKVILLTLLVWVLGRVEENAKKMTEKKVKISFVCF